MKKCIVVYEKEFGEKSTQPDLSSRLKESTKLSGNVGGGLGGQEGAPRRSCVETRAELICFLHAGCQAVSVPWTPPQNRLPGGSGAFLDPVPQVTRVGLLGTRHTVPRARKGAWCVLRCAPALPGAQTARDRPFIGDTPAKG